MKEKIKKHLTNTILFISLYLVSYAFMNEYFVNSYDDLPAGIYALAISILIIYVYRNER